MQYFNGTDYDTLYPYTTNELIGSLPIAGGTMTGNLVLSGDPTSNLMAASKQYVDNLVNSSSRYTFSVIATKTYSLDGIRFTGSVIEDSGVTVNIADFMNYKNLSQSLFLMVETNIAFYNPNAGASGWFNLTLAPGTGNSYFPLGTFAGTTRNSVSYSSKHIYPIFEVENYETSTNSNFYTFNDLDVNIQTDVEEIVKNLKNYSQLGYQATNLMRDGYVHSKSFIKLTFLG